MILDTQERHLAIITSQTHAKAMKVSLRGYQ